MPLWLWRAPPPLLHYRLSLTVPLLLLAGGRQRAAVWRLGCGVARRRRWCGGTLARRQRATTTTMQRTRHEPTSQSTLRAPPNHYVSGQYT
eukprot:scaffold9009_cov130-Isochrysis_galbana.AAC.12